MIHDLNRKKSKSITKNVQSNPDLNCHKKLQHDSDLDDSIEILNENETDSSDLVCQSVGVKMRWRYQIYRLNIQKVQKISIVLTCFNFSNINSRS